MQNAFQLLRPRFAPLLAFFLVFICFLPILRSGLYSDDLPNFQKVNYVAKVSWQQVFEGASHSVEHWKCDGRYTPISLYLQDVVFHAVSSVTGYKAYILCCDLLAVLAFVFMLWCFGQTEVITLFLLFFLGEIQFRIQMHDAFTSLHGMYPLLCFFSFVTIGFYALALNRPNKYLYFVALALSPIPILISESGIIVLPILFICGLFLSPNLKKGLLSLVPFAIVYGLYVLYLAMLRHSSEVAYTGLITNFNFDAMWNVVEIQVVSAMPFSNLYRQVDIPAVLAKQLNDTFNVVSVLFLVVGLVVLSFYFLKGKAERDYPKYAMLIIISLILLLLPAIILAPSVKYQKELWIGAGYLPVYIQNFGFALLLATLAAFFLKYNKVWARAVLILLFSANLLSVASSFLFNAALIRVRNYDISMPADALVMGVKRGILNSCPSESRIILAGNYHYGDLSSYTKIFENGSGKKFNLYNQGGWAPDTSDKMQNCYLLECPKGDTIYTRLYSLNCNTGAKIMLIKCDTVLHTTRVSAVEEAITNWKY